MMNLREVNRRLGNERGSASVEVVLFAMPLFIPLIMLASHVASVSASKIEISHLARTSLRAFVTASSTPLGHARVQQVLQVAYVSGRGSRFWNENLTSGSGNSGGNAITSEPTSHSRFESGAALPARFSYLIECRKIPCIQPLNRVRFTLEDRLTGAKVAASLITDQWIQAEPGYVPSEFSPLGVRDVADLEEQLAPFFDAKELIDQAREILQSFPSR